MATAQVWRKIRFLELICCFIRSDSLMFRSKWVNKFICHQVKCIILSLGANRWPFGSAKPESLHREGLHSRHRCAISNQVSSRFRTQGKIMFLFRILWDILQFYCVYRTFLRLHIFYFTLPYESTIWTTLLSLLVCDRVTTRRKLPSLLILW